MTRSRYLLGVCVVAVAMLLASSHAAAAQESAQTQPATEHAGAGHVDEGPAPARAAAEHPAPSTGHPEAGHPTAAGAHPAEAHGKPPIPSYVAALPFVAVLLCIAILPLIHRTEHWWHKNRNKLLVAMVLAAVTLVYYGMRDFGIGHGEHASTPGAATIKAVLNHAVLQEYIPFIVLLFSLYTVCGGIQLRGDLKATPLTNSCFLGTGAVLASLVGTTGAAMLLIRPVLQTNQQRRHVRHTVIFFIFLVANIGGSLLPIGDPPLFLGYLKGVPFSWTLGLWPQWLFTVGLVLAVYYVWDSRLYRRESPVEHLLDETRIQPLRLRGMLNFLWLAGVVFSVAFLVPGKAFLGSSWVVPDWTPGLREVAQLLLVAIAWISSSPTIRKENNFDFCAIIEVAVLFIGIFITMQVPVEILNIQGSELGLKTPVSFYWAAGTLSSFLDNAPTYVVFFETANSMTNAPGPGILTLVTGQFIREDLLVGISLGAVFMGSMTYIGNGPNFMVKSIAEQSGVKMPSFFGYMIYSIGVLIPAFVVMNVIFLVLLR